MTEMYYRAPSGSLIIAFRRGSGTSTPETPATVKPALRWEVRHGRGSLVHVWKYRGTSGPPPAGTIYEITASGQVVFSGTALINILHNILPTGKIQFQGGATIQYLANGVLVTEGVSRVTIGSARTNRIS